MLSAYQSSSGNFSIYRGSNNFGGGVGVEGSTNATQVPAAGVQGDNTSTASSAAVRANGFGGNLFVGNGSSGNDVFVVDNAGNVHAHSFTADLSLAMRSPNGSNTSTFSNESRLPTIEDFGEASLTAGQAYVRLNPEFADATVPGYDVFITPIGPTRGLYVSHRTAAGFYVRENFSGRSNAVFDYRVVRVRSLTDAAERPFITTHAPKVPLSAPPVATQQKPKP